MKEPKKLWGHPWFAWFILWLCMLVFAGIGYLVFPHTIEGWKGWLGYGVFVGFVWVFSLYATIRLAIEHRRKK